MEIPASSPDLFRLEGQVALVTGGSKGLGEAMATALSGAGADVVIRSRNLDECQAVSQQISRPTGNPDFLRFQTIFTPTSTRRPKILR
jgi:NAD(P)-dependent dehydrogenase (short-subunit alcohol dehydrogenase family)